VVASVGVFAAVNGAVRLGAVVGADFQRAYTEFVRMSEEVQALTKQFRV
jgi:hypothetical protein